MRQAQRKLDTESSAEVEAHLELALDAFEMAVWNRNDDSLDRLVHHGNRGAQHLSTRYSALVEAAGSRP